ncbi:hypothetical protein [Enterococcus sp. AZ109]|uniref:hypothetical protein n=1 Tax=Enterococcus sp. AZ109 TaxID=2774634 RepID=UPI003F26E954
MRGKDLLTALQVDATGSLNMLSSFTYVYAVIDEKQTNHLVVVATDNKIEIKYEAKQPPLTVIQLVEILNDHKEASLYLKNSEDQLIYGYRLVEEGIIIG